MKQNSPNIYNSGGHSVQDGDVRHFGMSKEGLVARQFMLGVVQTTDGMPIYHEVFDGNTFEAPTLLPTVRKVLARYPHIRRLVMVADRGLLSVDNLPVSGISNIHREQADLLAAMNIRKPVPNAQLSLL